MSGPRYYLMLLPLSHVSSNDSGKSASKAWKVCVIYTADIFLMHIWIEQIPQEQA